MGFDAIKKKSAAMGKSPSTAFLKINKYTNPKYALDLIGHICTSSKNLDLSQYFEEFYDLVFELRDKAEKDEVKWNSDEFLTNLWTCGTNLQQALETNTHNIVVKVSVAGGYSSGKSTFLNALTNNNNLLPTGIEPVSVVNTYLNCSVKTQGLVVKAENLNNDLVLLNQEVLDCIRHSKDSNVNVACVLNKIVIDIPSSPTFDGVTFIDTPGYNNSSARNTENSTTDSEMALSSFDNADVIFWCVDIENGAITEKDFQVLAKAQGKPYVIVFTKKDKKTQSEIEKIASQAYNDCIRRFGEDKKPIDIVAYSDRDGNNGEGSFYSRNNYSIEKLVSIVKENNGILEYDLCEWSLDDYFEQENKASIDAMKRFEEDRKNWSEEKAEWTKILHNNKDASSSEIDELREVMINSYNEILDYADGDFKYWKEEYRNELIERIKWWMERQHANVGEMKENAENSYKIAVENKKNEEMCQKYIAEYRQKLKSSLDKCYKEALCIVDRNNKQLQSVKQDEDCEVFSSISGDNYDVFLSCFSKGVNLADCNATGSNVITWVAQSGNNQMMKFLIDNGVDLGLKDSNGYNALEVATICHYKDICQMLVESDNSLVSQSESLAVLSRKNDFETWVTKL